MALRFRLLSATFILVLTCSTVNAALLPQIGGNTGLRGVVTDTTGAVLPGVTITITQVETGQKRTLTTSGSGAWKSDL